MQSAAQTVDEFLAEIAPPWDAVATRLFSVAEYKMAA